MLVFVLPDIVSHHGFLDMMQIPEPIKLAKVGYRVMCNKLTFLQHSDIEENMKKSISVHLTNIFSSFLDQEGEK